jgi:PAS domain S-box-containing protein
LSPTGTIEWANEAWLSLLGQSRSAVKDRPFAAFLSSASATCFESEFSPSEDGAGIDGQEIRLATGPAEGTPFALAAAVSDDEVHCQLSEISDYRERADRLERQNAKIEALHDVAMSIEAATEEQAIYETLVAAAEEVLDFDVAIADAAEGDDLVTRAVTEDVETEAYFDRVPIDDQSKLGTTVYRAGETEVVDDLAAAGWVDRSSPFRSALTVPIGDHGVFQTVDRAPDAFDEMDRDLAELLVAHGRNALSRLETLATLKRRTRSLGRERNRLAAIFEAVPEPIAHVRYEAGEPIVEAVNSAFEVTFGYNCTEVEGRSINDVIVPTDRLAEARSLDRQASESGVAEQEVTRQTVDGERTFRLRSSALETGGDPEALAIYVDLTEQKERERELEWENERLEQFASIVSHDLRSPLTVARGRLELVEDGEHVTAVRQAIDRMDAIIEDVLTLTRDGQTVTPEETEPVALAPLAEEA